MGGQMKSGTTMLRMMLSRHSSIYSGLETHWFLDDLYANYDHELNNSIDKLKIFFNISTAEMNFIINETKSKNNVFINNFFNLIIQKENKNRWLEKTPDNIKYLPLIDSQWDEYKFIHVIRDYRDIYASWKLSNKYDMKYFIDQVKLSYEGNDQILGVTTSKYIEIKYEDIVLDTKKQIDKILLFLNEDYEEDCISLDNKKAKKEFDIVHEVVGYKSNTLISTMEPINNNKIGQFKTVLTKKEIHLIEQELSEYMDLFEYKN